MIFSIEGHIGLIIEGYKNQTRRPTCSYKLGKSYSIQPGRTESGIPEGRILITGIKIEEQPTMISFSDAKAEGGYIPETFEALYIEMYPYWKIRYAYTFKFIPSSSRPTTP